MNENFEKRLQKLEQQNALLKKTTFFLLCLTSFLTSAVFFGKDFSGLIPQSRADLPVVEEISASRFILKDSMGNIRGVWQTNDAQGAVSFYIGDKDKRNAVLLHSDAQSVRAEILSDEEASLTIDGKKALLSEKGEELAFILKDTLQNTARLFVSSEFSGLEFYDKGDLRSITLGNRKGKASLDLFSTAYNSSLLIEPEKKTLFSLDKKQQIPFAEKGDFSLLETKEKEQQETKDTSAIADNALIKKENP